MAETVPLAEAAERLGVSERTLRRELARGRLRGTQVRTPHGYRWLVELPDSGEPPGRQVGTSLPISPISKVGTRHLQSADLADLVRMLSEHTAALEANTRALEANTAARQTVPTLPSVPTSSLALRITRWMRRYLQVR